MAAFRGEYPVVVLRDEDAVRALSVEVGVAAALCVDGSTGRAGCLAVTAPADGGGSLDFVARFFGPGVGIDEDPVTGSMFCDLGPYWCTQLSRPEVHGFQASPRGGHVLCRFAGGDQVTLVGGVVEYLRGEIVA